jgi:hypothetical protein
MKEKESIRIPKNEVVFEALHAACAGGSSESKFRFCGSGFQPRSDRGPTTAGLPQEKKLTYVEEG